MTARRRVALAAALAVALVAAGCDDADDAEDERPAAAAPQTVAATATAQTTRADATPPAATTPVAPTAPAAPRGGTEKVGIPAAGMGATIAALTAEVPAGWSTKGGVTWNERAPCMALGLRIEWAATSPDRTQAVEMIPGFSWQIPPYAVQLNPCPVARIASAEQYLRSLAGELYPGARISRYADLTPELPPTPQPPYPNMRARNEAGRIELAYEANGRPVKETLQALVGFTDATAPGSVSKMGLASYVLVVRGPADRFDETLGERFAKSLVPNQEWFAAVNERGKAIVEARSAQERAQITAWHSRRMAEISAKGAADRHAIRMNTIREVGEINAAGWKSRQESLDRMHRGNVDSIREVARYADTSSGRIVELSNHYNHGFRTQGGGYVATDDPNFNPGAGGAEMNRVR